MSGAWRNSRFDLGYHEPGCLEGAVFVLPGTGLFQLVFDNFDAKSGKAGTIVIEQVVCDRLSMVRLASMRPVKVMPRKSKLTICVMVEQGMDMKGCF